MKRFIPLRILLLVLILCNLQGCATYNTISEAKPGSPKIYSGTRLDVHAIEGNEFAQLKFKVDPPQHPALDLPFSFILDTIMLPLTFSISGYEALFGSD
jgi:uncharacterized protein YceK